MESSYFLFSFTRFLIQFPKVSIASFTKYNTLSHSPALVQAYTGNGIPELTGSVVFTDLLAREEGSQPPGRGVLAYTRVRTDGKPNDFSIIQTDYDFGSGSAYYVNLGTNLDQTRLYLGVYGSMNVTDKVANGLIKYPIPDKNPPAI